MTHVKRICILAIACICSPLFTQDPGTYPVLNPDVFDDYVSDSTSQDESYDMHNTVVREATHAGGKLLYDILRGEAPIYAAGTNNQKHFSDIKHVVTFLYTLSIPKTQTQNGANEVGFLIEDPEQHLYNFLRKYGRSDQDVHGNVYSIGKRSVYDHKNKGPLDNPGFAMTPIDAFTSDTPSFPAGQRTLFFQYDDTHKATYIRPECTDRYLHGPATTWTRSVRKYTKGSLSRICGATTTVWNQISNNGQEAPEQHEPHVPQDIQNRYQYIYNLHKDMIPAEKLDTTDSIYAIRNNLDTITSIAAKHNADTEHIDKFKTDIDVRFDYTDIAFGREIRFRLNQIYPMARFYALHDHTRHNQRNQLPPIFTDHEQDSEDYNDKECKARCELAILSQFAKVVHDMHLMRDPVAERRYQQRHSCETSAAYRIQNEMSTLYNEYHKNKNQIGDPHVKAYLQRVCDNIERLPYYSMAHQPNNNSRNILLAKPLE